MGVNEWLAVGVAVATLVAAFGGMVRWMVKYYLHELVPNSGSSLKDKVNKLESRVDEIYLLLIERGGR